jgi:hypothetical protein
MKKINFSHLPAHVLKTVLRFPVATLCCVALCVIDILMIKDVRWTSYEEVFFKLNLLLPLGFVLAIAVRMFAEDLRLRGWCSYADGLVIPLLAAYYFLLPESPNRFFDTPAVFYYAVFFLTALIGLCTAPCRRLAQPLLFWKYNVKIWSRAVFSGLCALIFIGGLCLALRAIEALFEVHIQEEWYQYILLLFCSLFASLFFAAGIPVLSQWTGDADKNYQVSRVLGQYVLLPILLVYFLILLAYGGRMLWLWELPKGWVSGLALAYSAAGLLIYFLLHNLYVTRSTKIAILFGRWFFYSELPVVALLGVAIFRRTSDYGITESRYYLWLAACWLLGVSLYMIFTKGKSFRPVLVSLAAAALLSVVGPWSAFNVSDSSQMRRLQQLMTKNDLLHDGKYVHDSLNSVTPADYNEMENILYYFAKKGNARRLQPLFTPDVDSLVREESRSIAIVDALLGGRAPAAETSAESRMSFTIEITDNEKNNIPITGYDRLFSYSYREWYADDETLSAQDSTFACKIKTRKNGVMELYRYGTLYKTISLPNVIRQITAVDWDDIQDDTFPADSLSVIIDPHCKIIFTEIQGTHNNRQPLELVAAEMYILEKE